VVLTGSEKEVDSLKDVGLVELRLDEFLREYDESELVNWIEKVKEKVKGKIIGTCRWYKEGGENAYYIRDKKRIEIYKEIIDYVDFIDIELKSRILKEVVGIAKEKNKKVIISYHNFKKTPDEKKLKTFVRKAKREGADIVKIATLSNNEKSLFNLIKLTHLYSEKIPPTPHLSNYLLLSHFLSTPHKSSCGGRTSPINLSYSSPGLITKWFFINSVSSILDFFFIFK